MIKLTELNSKQLNFRRLRQPTGSQIAELPPALTVLFFLFLLPALNLLYLACAFGVGWFLNNIELRDVSCHTPTSLGLKFPPTGAYQTINSTYALSESQKWNGLFGVMEDTSVSPQVAQFPVGGSAVTSSKVMTVVNIKPFYSVPYLKNIPILCTIPGLGQPITFTYYGTIQQEEPGP